MYSIESAYTPVNAQCIPCRSDSLHASLVSLAASTLYDEGFQPLAQASRSSLADMQKQDGSDADEQIVASDNEDAASFRTATGNSEEAAALGNQVASYTHPCILLLHCRTPASCVYFGHSARICT